MADGQIGTIRRRAERRISEIRNALRKMRMAVGLENHRRVGGRIQEVRCHSCADAFGAFSASDACFMWKKCNRAAHEGFPVAWAAHWETGRLARGLRKCDLPIDRGWKK